MKLFLLALLPFASQAENQKCYTGTIKANGKNVTKDELMDGLGPLLEASIVSTIHSSASLSSFMKKAGRCQTACLEDVMEQTVSTLYGKLGKDFFVKDDVSIEALTGAFRACYPSPPRQAIHEIAKEVIESMGTPPTKKQSFPRGVECENEEHLDDFPMKATIDEFGDAFHQVISNHKEAMKFFSEVAMDCQLPCVKKTVSLSMKTLFLTGQRDQKVQADAITGAMHACFPGVPSEEIQHLVDSTMTVMNHAQDAANTRLYATNMMKWGSYSFLTSGSLVAAMSLALFSAGAAVGRRWNRSPNREVELLEIENDQRSLIAP